MINVFSVKILVLIVSMNAKTAEWRPGPSVCRCCLTEGCYKDISTEYFWMGRREVYAEMLSDTFDLTVSCYFLRFHCDFLNFLTNVFCIILSILDAFGLYER